MYALNLSEDFRILSVAFLEYASENSVIVESLPEGNIADYLYINGEFVHDPILVDEKPSEYISQEERIAALEAALLELMGVTVDG